MQIGHAHAMTRVKLHGDFEWLTTLTATISLRIRLHLLRSTESSVRLVRPLAPRCPIAFLYIQTIALMKPTTSRRWTSYCCHSVSR